MIGLTNSTDLATARLTPETMKTKTRDQFGPRLAALRESRGMTQTELGDAAGVSQRMIAYYEMADAQPPGSLLVTLARALKVSADELLGLKPVTEKTSPKTARLLKRLRRIEELPAADQRAVLKLVDALLETRRRTRKAS
jgi:transcriptional regulator with XRE-family HTH domain